MPNGEEISAGERILNIIRRPNDWLAIKAPHAQYMILRKSSDKFDLYTMETIKKLLKSNLSPDEIDNFEEELYKSGRFDVVASNVQLKRYEGDEVKQRTDRRQSTRENRLPSLKSIFLELVKNQQQKAYVKKHPFNPNPEINKPYGVPPSGIYTKSFHTRDGTYSGGNGVPTQGVSGLSRAKDKFDLPPSKPVRPLKRIGEDNDNDLDEYGNYSDPNDTRLPWETNEPVGQGGPKFIGGRNFPNLKGMRRK